MRTLADGSVERIQNISELKNWLNNPFNKNYYEQDLLLNHEALLEALAFGLRNMHVGVDPKALALRHQCSLPVNFNEIT